MGKILLFLYDNMADFEFTLAGQLLRIGLEKEIVTFSYRTEPVLGRSGAIYLPEYTVEQVFDLEVEGLILTGGYLKNIEDNLIQLIKKLDSEKKLLAAICAAPRILAVSRVLSGRNYTTSLEEWTIDVAKDFGDIDPFPRETFVNERLVKDEYIITAKGIAFIDFAVELYKYFAKENAEEDAKELLVAYKG